MEWNHAPMVHMIKVGIAKRTVLELIELDVVKAVSFAGTRHLTVLIHHEGIQIQEFFCFRIKEVETVTF